MKFLLVLLIAAGMTGAWARSRRREEAVARWACVMCSDAERAGPCFGPGRCFGVATSWREDDDGIAPMDPWLVGLLG